MVEDKDIVVDEFTLRHKPTDSIGIQYVDVNKTFEPSAPWFQFKQINRTLILDVDLYYNPNVCGVIMEKAIKRHLTLTLTK